MPLAQLVVSATAVLVHVPLLQASVVQSFASLQDAHAAPPLPHAAALLVPGWQVVPSQQPVQHAPCSHLPVPPAQLVPGVAGVAEHVPFVQLGIMHSLVVLQLTHAAPAAPHDVVSVPAEQALPFQQPVQQLPPKHSPPLHGV